MCLREVDLGFSVGKADVVSTQPAIAFLRHAPLIDANSTWFTLLVHRMALRQQSG